MNCHNDYKLFCFQGTTISVMICTERNLTIQNSILLIKNGSLPIHGIDYKIEMFKSVLEKTPNYQKLFEYVQKVV